MFIEVVLLCLGFITVQYALAKLRLRERFPPGPPKWPAVGNALQMPPTHQWFKFSEWTNKYGPIVHLDVFGQSYITLNSVEVAKDLLAKRSSIYSDRPHIPMLTLSGFDISFSMKPYGDEWSQDRRLIAQHMSNSTLSQYIPLQEREARNFVHEVLSDAMSPEAGLHVLTGRILFQLIYGYRPSSEDDSFLSGITRVMECFSSAGDPGAWAVNIIPQMRWLPYWFPGATFQRVANKYHRECDASQLRPFLWSKDAISSGTPLAPNFCERLLADGGSDMTTEENLNRAWCAGTLLGGGVDGLHTTLCWFLVALSLHPGVQRKAQAELDAVAGPDRLPTLSDKPALPYVRCVVTEVHRLHPAGPLGVPHASAQDDVYEGMFIPKGSIIIPNMWHMLRDPVRFPRPEDFNPDRYGLSDVRMRDVTDIVFGFGRRACPGSGFADNAMFALAVTVLATCDVFPAKDGQSREIKTTSGAVSLPLDFPVRLQYRSPNAMDLLNAAVQDADPSI